MDLSENALEVLKARYLRRNREGEVVETPEGLFERVARAVAEPELLYGSAADARKWGEEFYRMMVNREFMPNSPTLMNAGTAVNQLSACFVLPVGDSIEEIFDALRDMALVQRSGGGTGFSFSRLRPKGDFIASTSGRASGPVSFMNIFDRATTNIKQGGRRRGANMGILRIDHPDIMEFVEAKRKEGTFENFNLSVLVDDAFMTAVREDGGHELRHPEDRRVVGRLNAAELFDAICRAAWETGDPGMIFADTVNAANPTPALGEMIATNPCGEIPLLDYESCNLGSVNLYRMIDVEHRRVDWGKLKSTVAKGVRFLDNVIDACRFPIREIEKMTRGNRKVGIGVMGLAEMLIRMGVSYASDEGVSLTSRVMSAVATEAARTSAQLAEKRGVYPNWNRSVHRKRGERFRNATRTAVAPTGSISIIAGVNPGIEPLFALAYRRSNVLEGRTLHEVTPLFRWYAVENGLDPQRIIDRIRAEGSLSGVEEVPEGLKRIFKTAPEIPAIDHLRVQEAAQRHVDNAVSKTINMPQETTVKDVADAYRLAWEMGLKGITIYRYGSKSRQVMEIEAAGRNARDCDDCGV